MILRFRVVSVGKFLVELRRVFHSRERVVIGFLKRVRAGDGVWDFGYRESMPCYGGMGVKTGVRTYVRF